MTLLLPKNICENYVFAYNETHAALILDYGSVINHHESANARATHFPDVNHNLYIQVRMDANQNVLTICIITYIHHINMCT